MSTVTGWGAPADLRAGIADTASDWQHPAYYSNPTDPMFTIKRRADGYNSAYWDVQIRIPQAARPAAGGDGHFTVVDQSTGTEWDMYKVATDVGGTKLQRLPTGGGTIYARGFGKSELRGTGINVGTGNATAAHFGNLAGSIRAQELEAGRIDHALFMLVKCDSGAKVYPAQGLGYKCPNPANAPAEGMRFALSMSDAQIEALAVPRWKKTVLRAMAHYGMYVGDTTGGTPWTVWAESGSTYTSFGQEDRMDAVARSAGIPRSGDGAYYFDMRTGVDWQRYLRVVDPCVSEKTC